MSAKTKIVVLHMKELIYTAIFVGLGILLIILLLCMFLPKEKESSVESATYVPGVYTSTITFQDQTMDVQVVVEENKIHSISLVNLSETVTTMYPLMETTMEQVRDQIIEKQSLENITYTTENQYTTTVLVNAVKEALDKAVVEENSGQVKKEEPATENSPTVKEEPATESSPTVKEEPAMESGSGT